MNRYETDAQRRARISAMIVPRTTKKTVAFRSNVNPIVYQRAPTIIVDKRDKGEKKYLDTLIETGVGPSAGITFWTLNLFQTGASYYNRIGAEIKLKSLEINGRFKVNQTGVKEASNGAIEARAVIIYDKQANYANPGALGNVLAATSQIGTNTIDVYSLPYVPNKSRFKIIRDWKITLPNISYHLDGADNICDLQEPADAESIRIHDYIKLGNLTTKYSHSTNPADIGNIATGALHFFVYGDRVKADGNPFWYFQGTIRCVANDK